MIPAAIIRIDRHPHANGLAKVVSFECVCVRMEMRMKGKEDQPDTAKHPAPFDRWRRNDLTSAATHGPRSNPYQERRQEAEYKHTTDVPGIAL